MQRDDLAVTVGEPGAGRRQAVEAASWRSAGQRAGLTHVAVDAEHASVATGPTEGRQAIDGIAGTTVTAVPADTEKRSAISAVAAGLGGVPSVATVAEPQSTGTAIGIFCRTVGTIADQELPGDLVDEPVDFLAEVAADPSLDGGVNRVVDELLERHVRRHAK